jgi:hypothetical protein
MRHGSRRRKGRRLQVHVAEVLSARFDLTIEAVPPTKPGRRANGAQYVGEEGPTAPDVRVRPSGDPGADVALLSAKAQAVRLHGLPPFWIECKNTERWAMGAAFWTDGALPEADDALRQVTTGMQARKLQYTPLIVLGRNNHPPVAGVAVHSPAAARTLAKALMHGKWPPVVLRSVPVPPWAWMVLMPLTALFDLCLDYPKE